MPSFPKIRYSERTSEVQFRGTCGHSWKRCIPESMDIVFVHPTPLKPNLCDCQPTMATRSFHYSGEKDDLDRRIFIEIVKPTKETKDV